MQIVVWVYSDCCGRLYGIPGPMASLLPLVCHLHRMAGGTAAILNCKNLANLHCRDMVEAVDDLIATRTTLIDRLKNWQDQSSWQSFFDSYWRLIYGVARKSGFRRTPRRRRSCRKR